MTVQEQTIRDMIINTLTYYGPRLSKSMLSAHVASYANRYGYRWEDTLTDLVNDGTVTCTAEQHGQRRALTIYQLASSNS